MEDYTPVYVNKMQIENVKSYVGLYLGQKYSTRDKIPDKEIQTRITTGCFRQAPRRLQGQHRNMREETNLHLMRTSSNDIRHENMGTHHPSKEQASSRKNNDGKENVKHHIQGQKKHLGKRKDKGQRRD